MGNWIAIILLFAATAFACPVTNTIKGRAVQEIAPNVFVGVGRVRVTLSTRTEIIAQRQTNPFGYFEFTNVAACSSGYKIGAIHKHLLFESKTFRLPAITDDDPTDVFQIILIGQWP